MRDIIWRNVKPPTELEKRIMEHLADIDQSLTEICGIGKTCDAIEGWGRTKIVCGERAVAQVTPPANALLDRFGPARSFNVCASCRDKFMAQGYRIEQPIPPSRS